MTSACSTPLILSFCSTSTGNFWYDLIDSLICCADCGRRTHAINLVGIREGVFSFDESFVSERDARMPDRMAVPNSP